MYKRGQFFLVAAIIIAGALFALGTIYVSSSSPRLDTSVDYLSEQIFTESSSVVDSGIFNGVSESEITQRKLDLIANYSRLYPQNDILMIYGDQEGIYYEYIRNKDVTTLGTSSFPTSGKIQYTATCLNPEQKGCIYISSNNDLLIVRLPNNEQQYKFNLTTGQPFYLVVRQDSPDERIVSTK